MSDLKAVFDTSKGKINITLFAVKAPYTVANFVNLAQRGYYDGLIFHRVISDFMVQGGCPDGTGRGGPGYNFDDGFDSTLGHDKPGVLSMSNSGPGTNGSQFFVTHGATPWLDGKHSVFGCVVADEDQKVVDALAQDDKINSLTIEGDISALFEQAKDKLEEWNAALDKK